MKELVVRHCSARESKVKKRPSKNTHRQRPRSTPKRPFAAYAAESPAFNPHQLARVQVSAVGVLALGTTKK